MTKPETGDMPVDSRIEKLDYKPPMTKDERESKWLVDEYRAATMEMQRRKKQ